MTSLSVVSLGSVSSAVCTCIVVLLLTGNGRLYQPVDGYFMSMISESQFYVVDPGESVVMECSFHADRYSMFDYPVIWRKRQLTEDLPINILGNINEPFVATNRFEVNLVAHEPRYQLELLITDVEREDSGNYTCELRGSHSMLLAQVTHFLFVRAPVESVHLSLEFPLSHHAQRPTSSTSSGGDPMTSSHPGHSSPSTYVNRLPTSASAADLWLIGHGPPVIRVVENHPCGLVCTALGGSPPPKIELSVERGRDLTSSTTLLQIISPAPTDNGSTAIVTRTRTDRSSSAHVDGIWTSGSRRGFRHLTVTTVRSTRNYLPTADDDGRRLLCIVTVPGLASRVDAVVLDVDYLPKISCMTTEASIDDVDVSLKCDVRAKPKSSGIFWILSANGSTLHVGEVSDNYWAIIRERRDDVTEALIYMRRATPDRFRRYTIVAENSVGIGRRDVELIQSSRPHAPVRPLSDAASVSSHAVDTANRNKKQQHSGSSRKNSTVSSLSSKQIFSTGNRAYDRHRFWRTVVLWALCTLLQHLFRIRD